MKINKHGKIFNKEETTTKEKFTCENCECEFTAKDDEYYVDFGGADSSGWTVGSSITYTISTVTKDYLVCSCPECHKICKKIRERKTENYYTNSNITTTTLDLNGHERTLLDKVSATWTCEDSLDEALTMK